jgi:hypothetical protein
VLNSRAARAKAQDPGDGWSVSARDARFAISCNDEATPATTTTSRRAEEIEQKIGQPMRRQHRRVAIGAPTPENDQPGSVFA